MSSYQTLRSPKITPELESSSKKQLLLTAKKKGFKGYSKLNKSGLVQLLRKKKVKSPSPPRLSDDSLYYGVDLNQIPIYYSPSPRTPSPKPMSISPSPKPKSKSPSLKKKSASPKPKSPEKYIRKVGPPGDLEKYGIIQELGKGRYGATYKARNLNKKQDEKDYYAVKILKDTGTGQDWMKETVCLINVLEICSDVGILCYKDSFIVGKINKNGAKEMEFVIVNELLEGYQSLNSYLVTPDEESIKISEEKALDIYQQVVDIKNALTELCINHSDLHTENIMINPKTGEIKVIDLGRCQTPEEEIKEWGNIGSDKWNLYSDEARFQQLRKILYNSVRGSDYYYLDWPNKEHDTFFSHIKIDPTIKGCSRKSLPVYIKKEINDNIEKIRNQGFPV
jgi:hypothetical protein